MPKLVNSHGKTPNPPAAGLFGMDERGAELRSFRPLGCPSLEQFEASFRRVPERPGSA